MKLKVSFCGSTIVYQKYFYWIKQRRRNFDACFPKDRCPLPNHYYLFLFAKICCLSRSYVFLYRDSLVLYVWTTNTENFGKWEYIIEKLGNGQRFFGKQAPKFERRCFIQLELFMHNCTTAKMTHITFHSYILYLN